MFLSITSNTLLITRSVRILHELSISHPPSFCQLERLIARIYQSKLKLLMAVFSASDWFLTTRIENIFTKPSTDRFTSIWTIRKELENLQRVKTLANIVQQAGVMVAPNPYMTSQRNEEQPLVITGILLEYCGGGSLQYILGENRISKFRWQIWPLQIGIAFSQLHAIEQTHMDIKPSNIVLDLKGNATLIDISGMGFTHAWLAPEMKDEASPVNMSPRSRLLHDIWAYGKLLNEIAIHIDGDSFATKIQIIAKKLMHEEPKLRMRLSTAITQLRQALPRDSG
ncbi:hypothetical protein PRK78_004583 [Emydomyces testavorans]|uniref:Protein kinase domain-containing protein n=1 Tax=Emydomyces testavorans TaxID=2070801 RepID=A0AAF0ILT0_9EURO|nr:hypothetical protein PRK78_004583 [Emydomyces testavorans]